MTDRVDKRGLLRVTDEAWETSDLPPRPYRHDRPVAIDDTPVKVRGEELHRVLWRGRQWAVTTHGIERLDGTYAIAADRLLEMAWPEHVTAKIWADSDDFCTAWLVALPLHGVRITARQAREHIAHSWVRKEPTP